MQNAVVSFRIMRLSDKLVLSAPRGAGSPMQIPQHSYDAQTIFADVRECCRHMRMYVLREDPRYERTVDQQLPRLFTCQRAP